MATVLSAWSIRFREKKCAFEFGGENRRFLPLNPPSTAKKRQIGSASSEIDPISRVSNEFQGNLTRNRHFSRALRKKHAQFTIPRLLSEKTICNAPFLVFFLKSKRAMVHSKS